MKLYNVPKNTLVRVITQPVEEEIANEDGQLEMNVRSPNVICTPVATPQVAVDAYIHFGHIDGMYSFGYNMHQEVVHLAAWTEVEIVDWSYDNMELLRTLIKRGGRGIDGTEPLTWVTTDKMNDEWVAACVTYEELHRPNNAMIKFYKWELKYREEHEISVKA